MVIAAQEPPYAAIAAFLLLALTAIGLLRSWWRRRKYPIFGTRKNPADENHG
jgi:MYXO-CTERM domain-containing protein